MGMRVLLVTLLLAAACAAPPAAVTASPPPTATPSPSPTLTPHPRPAGYTVVAGSGVDVLGEPGVPAAALERVRKQAEQSVVAIAADVDHAFEPRPAIYVFASTASFETGLVRVFELPAGTAARTAQSASAVAMRPSEVAANWSKLEKYNVLSAIHHELTHLAIMQRLPVDRSLPAWLNEGTAYLAETTLLGMTRRANEIRYTTASLAHGKDLFSWTDLEGPTFAGRAAIDPAASYSQAAQMVQFVQDEVGKDALRRILALMDRGEAFENAFRDVMGKPMGDLVTLFPDRALALAPSYPGMVVSVDAPIGGGPTLLLYGFPAQAAVEVALTDAAGHRYVGDGTITTSGTYTATLGDVAPGTYRATATAGGASATASVAVSR